MYKKALFISLIIKFCTISACAGSAGFERTPFNDFKAVPFKSLGIQMDLPEKPIDMHSTYLIKIYDSEAFRRNTGGTALVIFFHPHWISGVASEPEYYLVFNLVRKESVENLFRRFNPVGTIENYNTNDNNLVKGWIGKDEYSDRVYYLFQRNIKIQKNIVVSAGAKLLHRPIINQKENFDIQVIRRILNSIQPIPEE